jgi:multicomponent Na+:H+ antiporter subunit G
MIIDLLSWICLIGGGVVGIIGGIGIHLFPDFYSRQHATGTTDTLCALLILLGLGLQAGLTLAAFKLALVFLLLFVTSPTASHALAHAAMHSGLRPMLANSAQKGKEFD